MFTSISYTGASVVRPPSARQQQHNGRMLFLSALPPDSFFRGLRLLLPSLFQFRRPIPCLLNTVRRGSLLVMLFFLQHAPGQHFPAKRAKSGWTYF